MVWIYKPGSSRRIQTMHSKTFFSGRLGIGWFWVLGGQTHLLVGRMWEQQPWALRCVCWMPLLLSIHLLIHWWQFLSDAAWFWSNCRSQEWMLQLWLFSIKVTKTYLHPLSRRTTLKENFKGGKTCRHRCFGPQNVEWRKVIAASCLFTSPRVCQFYS